MRITSKGQVTIPADIREQVGLLPGAEVDFVLEKNGVRLVRASAKGKKSRGERVLAKLRGSATVRMSTDEIMALTRRGPE
ncbi:MAG: AbrB/MazE/SpoVT family DNA-binding domain-containing protein [Geminicoccaceae bacterium]